MTIANRSEERGNESLVARLLHASGDLLLPIQCCFCSSCDVMAQRRYCASCADQLCADPNRQCLRCASFVNPYAIRTDGCAHCRTRRYRFDQATSLGPYEGALRDAIVRMKQSAKQSLTFAIGQLVADRAVTQLNDLPELVIPAPMHWFRRLFRTTNSPDFLAAGFANVLGLPAPQRYLVARRATKKQSQLTTSERERNVAGAFRCQSNAKITGRHVAVVDDIMTTGVTLNALSSVLKGAGAAKVTAITVARAQRMDVPIRKPR